MANDVLKQIWPEWQIEGKPLGRGSFGVVYKAVRRDHNVESFAAIKVISIPADPSEVDSLRSEGLDMNATRTYLQGIVNDFVSEIQLMESLKGVQNIVSVEDYKVVEKTGEIGWDIYIRMELLTSFNTYICDKKLTEEEIIKLGCDICTALEICSKRNIIHRDIKPENIFINDFGYFKLGDFGIARKMENMTGGLSQKGSPNYMAPEVTNGSEYDSRVDTYSLGIVLYRLLNGNRLPFLDSEKQLLNPNERRLALDRRLRGEELPAPCDASPAMADLILRACAYDPNMRFASATEMKQALMSVANGTYQMVASNLDRTTSVRRAPTNYDKTTSVRKAPISTSKSNEKTVNTFGTTTKKNSSFKLIAIILALVIITGIGVYGYSQFAKVNAKREAISEALDNAAALANELKYDKAIHELEETLEKYPGESEVSEKLDQYRADQIDYKVSLILESAEKLAVEQDIEGAEKKISEGLSDYPDNAELLQKQNEYKAILHEQNKAQALSDAKNLADAGDYKSAMSIIANAQSQLGEDKDFDTAYAQYRKADALQRAEKAVSSGDYPGAITIISTEKANSPADPDVLSAYNEYTDNYVSNVLATTDSLMAARKHADALAEITSALKVLPNNEQLLSRQTEINAAKPISITTLTPVNRDDWGGWNEGSPVDPFGNDYSTACNYVIFHGYDLGIRVNEEHYEEYRLYGKYSLLTGSIVDHIDCPEDRINRLQIYADDTLVYTSVDLTRKTDAINFAVDVTGVEYVKIVVYTDSGAYCILSNVQLWP